MNLINKKNKYTIIENYNKEDLMKKEYKKPDINSEEMLEQTSLACDVTPDHAQY